MESKQFMSISVLVGVLSLAWMSRAVEDVYHHPEGGWEFAVFTGLLLAMLSIAVTVLTYDILKFAFPWAWRKSVKATRVARKRQALESASRGIR